MTLLLVVTKGVTAVACEVVLVVRKTLLLVVRSVCCEESDCC